jgi:hypothetical protein
MERLTMATAASPDGHHQRIGTAVAALDSHLAELRTHPVTVHAVMRECRPFATVEAEQAVRAMLDDAADNYVNAVEALATAVTGLDYARAQLLTAASYAHTTMRDAALAATNTDREPHAL